LEFLKKIQVKDETHFQGPISGSKRAEIVEYHARCYHMAKRLYILAFQGNDMEIVPNEWLYDISYHIWDHA